MDGGSPAPASSGASFVSVSGSLAPTAAISPRLTTCSISVNPFGSGSLAGQATSLTWSLVTRLPIGMSATATTWCTLRTSTSRTGMRWIAW